MSTFFAVRQSPVGDLETKKMPSTAIKEYAFMYSGLSPIAEFTIYTHVCSGVEEGSAGEGGSQPPELCNFVVKRP